MRRRAFGIVELLVVVAIVAILAGLLHPVFAESRRRADLTACATRLHGIGLALNLYREDHDGRGVLRTPSRQDDPYYTLSGLRGYLAGGAALWCESSEEHPTWDGRFVQYRAFNLDPDAKDGPVLVPPVPVPASIVAYCTNHARGGFDERYGTGLRKGVYPFVREDASAGLARSEAIRLGFYDRTGWYDVPTFTPRVTLLRFPGEPWPPTLER